MTFRGMVVRLRREARAGTCLPFVVTYEDQLVGQLTVGGIAWGSFRSAHVGYWIDSAVAGRGIMPTALALAVDHCFRTVGLHRIEINIRPENMPSRRVVEKLGFRDEGLRPRLLHIDGDWRDHLSYALTADESGPAVSSAAGAASPTPSRKRSLSLSATLRNDHELIGSLPGVSCGKARGRCGARLTFCNVSGNGFVYAASSAWAIVLLPTLLHRRPGRRPACHGPLLDSDAHSRASHTVDNVHPADRQHARCSLQRQRYGLALLLGGDACCSRSPCRRCCSRALPRSAACHGGLP